MRIVDDNVVTFQKKNFQVLTDYVQKKYLDQRCKFVKESLVKSVVSHWWNDTGKICFKGTFSKNQMSRFIRAKRYGFTIIE